jgi:hypothetical protein
MSVPFRSACRACGRGLMSEVVQLTHEERIQERFGRLMLVGRSNRACCNREWAHRWEGETQVDLVTGRCGHCGGAHRDENLLEEKMRNRLFRAVQWCSSL